MFLNVNPRQDIDHGEHAWYDFEKLNLYVTMSNLRQYSFPRRQLSKYISILQIVDVQHHLLVAMLMVVAVLVTVGTIGVGASERCWLPCDASTPRD